MTDPRTLKEGSGSVLTEKFNAIVDVILSGLRVTASNVDSGAAQDGDVLTADGAGGASWEAGGGSQPGALRILPVVIDLEALALGEQTLYTPSAGDWVVVTLSADGFEASSVDWDLYIGQNLAASPGNYFLKHNDISSGIDTLVDQVGGLGASSGRVRSGVQLAALDGVVEDTSPLVAALKPDLDISTVFCRAGGSWEPNHAYAAFEAVMGSDGALYTVAFGDDGISGGTEPTWPGTGTVVDGTVTWTFSDKPVGGSLTCVLLIASAA